MMRQAEYTGIHGVTFKGPEGDGYTNPVRDLRDEWNAMVLRAGARNVTVSLPTPPAPDADPKPDAVAQARERFTEAAIAEQEARRALGVAMGRPDDEVTDEELRELSAKMDTADDRLNEAYMMLLAAEQAEREGGA